MLALKHYGNVIDEVSGFAEESAMTDYNVELVIKLLRQEPNNARIPDDFWSQLATSLAVRQQYWLYRFLDKNSDLPYDEVYFKALAAVEDWHRKHPKS